MKSPLPPGTTRAAIEAAYLADKADFERRRRPTLTPRQAAEAAAAAHIDLVIFGQVIALLEGGNVHSRSQRAAARLIAICKAEQGRRLADYDAAMALIPAARP